MSTTPAKPAFIGFNDLRQQILRQLKQGSSIAVVGGRKCGGSSFLESLADEIPSSDLRPYRPVPVPLNLREICPRSPLELFRSIYERLTAGCDCPAWATVQVDQGYQQFLRFLRLAEPGLRQKYGDRWLAILFLDPLDIATQFLPDEEAFHNLRSLLTDSPFRPSFRVVAWGGSGITGLIRITSPLNNLHPKYMRLWTADEGIEYIRRIHPNALPGVLEDAALALSGRHPYLLLGLMRKVEEGSLAVTPEVLDLYGRSFMRDRRGVFEHWLDDFGPSGREVYSALSQAPGGTLTFEELQARVSRPSEVEESILTLSYHCVIDALDPDRPRLEGKMFKDWFDRNAERPVPPPRAVPAQCPPSPTSGRGRKVFVVHGRNERIRASTFNFLRALGLEPIEWHHAVEATGDAAPHISDILDSGFKVATAAVVLLTPDDEARLKDKYVTPSDPDYERNATGQPRPNVLFEAGMAWAKFPKRTIFVQVGSIRPFSDMAGIHMVSMDNSMKRRKDLASRLKLAGCNVIDIDESTEWHDAGDFDVE